MAAKTARYVLPVLTILLAHAFGSPSAHASQEGGLPQVRDDLTALQAVVANLANDLAATKADLASTKADLANTKADLASTRADLAATEADLAATKVLLADTRASVDSLTQQVSDQGSTLGNNVSQALASISTANTSIASLFGSLDSVRTSVGTLNTAQSAFAETSRAAGNLAFDALARQAQQATQNALFLKLAAGGAPASGQSAQDALDLLAQAQAQFAAGASDALIADLGLTSDWSAAAQRMAAQLADAQQKIAAGDSISLADALVAQTKEVEAIQQEVLDQSTQLSLQMLDDRVNKLYTTLSNIMKKMNDTSASIIQNLK